MMTFYYRISGLAKVLAGRLGVLCISLLLSIGLLQPGMAQAADPCAPVVSPVTCENSKPGSPASQWDISGAGDASIQGFATDISVNKGTTLGFKIKTNASAYRLDIYRMGYYAGSGARKIATVMPSAALPQTQPACSNQAATGLIDCGNWAQSATWAIPATAVSGIYFAKLVRADNGGASHITFVVRDDASHSSLLFQTSDTTWQAYNNYGGNSLYAGSPAGRAYKVSYNRPFNTRANSPEDFVFSNEYPMVRWLEANGYDVAYASGLDTDRLGSLIPQHKTFMSVGHDEYWSGGQRTKVEAARNTGVNLAFFSGNESFWKTRWENSIAGTTTANRTLTCYKETHAGAKIDPTSTWTGSWRDPRFSPPADGGRPENALTGTLFMVNGSADRADSIKVPAADGKMRFWRNTSLATQTSGATATLAAGTLGYEWDADVDNGSRPAGLVKLSTATYNLPNDVLQDYGSTFGAGTVSHSLAFYKAPSGARVFGAGSVQWSWGLDSTHDRTGPAADVRIRQATVNLLADMGAQPATLQTGLVLATASTDITKPASVIASPPAGSLPGNAAVTVSGTATDTGGQVGGVEVSIDNGTTWHPATGRANWTYTFTTPANTTFTIKSRAADDSGNIETPSAGRTFTTGSLACPCSIWTSATTPGTIDDGDPNAVELGVKFQTNTNGYIRGIRFYKGSANVGSHTGTLWSGTGTQLATATFASETASGWQQVLFSAPVAVTAGTTYIASYHTNGHYSADTNSFATALTSGPLQVLSDGASGGNGVYHYGAKAFPTDTYQSSNYWVDVVFATSP